MLSVRLMQTGLPKDSMLFWAVFTLGYIIGTLFTLVFFFKRSEEENFKGYFVEGKDFAQKNSWDKFNDLIKVNFTKCTPPKPLSYR